MQVWVGLGNPEPAYAGHRHNVGFMALEAMVARGDGFGPWRRKFRGLLTEGRIGGQCVLALKPMTFMNRSGDSVAELLAFYKLDPTALLVLHDELDLAPGKVRVKLGGGVAGHNGLRSIASHIGPHFRRVRIGIGHPGDKARVTGHVLGDFAKADKTWLEPLLDSLARRADFLARGEEERFMTAVAQDTAPPKPKPKPKPKPESKPGPEADQENGPDGL